MKTNTEYIAIENLSFTFLNDDNYLKVIDDINLNIRQNEFISLIGPSGCGKTTLLRLIGNLIDDKSQKKQTGKIIIGQKTPREIQNDYNIGFAFQDAVLLPWRKVKDNLNLPVELIIDSSKDYWDNVDLLKKLGLWEFRDSYPNELSGGMKQRLAIARTLIFKPYLLLMDEPFGALDASTREELNIELLKIWRETNATVVFVTHSISEAIFLSDRVITLSKLPACIQHELKIELERPRDIRIKESEQFIKYSKILREELEKARK